MKFDRKLVLAAAAVAGLAVASAPFVVRAQAPGLLTWTAEPSKEGDGRVQLHLSYREGDNHNSSYGRTIDFAQLSGFSRAQFDAPSTSLVRFRLTRDAGAFDCEGSARAQFGSGSCEFQANPGFARTLEQRGAGSPRPGQLFELAMSDIGVAYLDELRRQRYATASVDDLVRAGQHGASLKFLQGMDAAGYRVGDVGSLIRLRDHGVTPTYAGELKAAGISGLAAEDLVRMRDHGVTARYLQEVRAARYARLPAERLIWMRDHGVTASFLQGLQSAGYANLAPEHLVLMRDHGVSATYVQGLQAIGYANIPPEQLVRMRDHGVTPDFIRRVNVDRKLEVEELIQLRDRGGR